MTVDVVDRATGSIQRIPLEFDEATGTCQIRLSLTPGASSVQVTARNGAGVVASLEIAAKPGEQVPVEFRRLSSGEIRAFSRKRFFILPDEEPPATVLLKSAPTDELDLVVLVDGTCLHPHGDAGDLAYLLSPEVGDVWKDITGRIGEFIQRVSAPYPKLWAMTMAFGDEPMATVANPLLKPAYLLYPEASDRELEQLTPDQIVQRLRRLPYTPGGDFTDALADGLLACCDAPWRTGSRKLVVVFGQSPGYSVLDVEDDMTNLIVRHACMEEAVMALWNRGIEVITIFHEPADAEERYKTNASKILRRAREQYGNLASLAEWSCLSPAFDVEKLANAWLNAPVVLGRGACPGMLAGDSAALSSSGRPV